MLGHQWQKDAVKMRRETRDMTKQGWEYVGEGGGNLWKLYRGGWVGKRITEARVAYDGLGVWVRVG